MKYRKFYGISDEMDSTLLLTRCKEGRKKNIYFTSPLVRDLTELNFDRITVGYLYGFSTIFGEVIHNVFIF